MKIKELDVIILKDGKQVTVLESYEQGEVFLVEVADERGQTLETPIVKISDVEKVIYTA